MKIETNVLLLEVNVPLNLFFHDSTNFEAVQTFEVALTLPSRSVLK